MEQEAVRFSRESGVRKKNPPAKVMLAELVRARRRVENALNGPVADDGPESDLDVLVNLNEIAHKLARVIEGLNSRS